MKLRLNVYKLDTPFKQFFATNIASNVPIYVIMTHSGLTKIIWEGGREIVQKRSRLMYERELKQFVATNIASNVPTYVTHSAFVG